MPLPLSFIHMRSRGHIAVSNVATNNRLSIMATDQYFTVPHLFLQESGHSTGILVESTGILLQFHWNKNGIKQTKVEILIYFSTLPSSMSSARFRWNPMECWNSTGNPQEW